ncbi:MAG: hypothetical protein SVO96_06390 [Pseudomonadota bacterium]|nr:hypothetical protein [Pseudomonadota bacterium]
MRDMDRDYDCAGRIATNWIAAWHRRDLDAILGQCTQDVEISSPDITAMPGHRDGVLRGWMTVGAYWAGRLAGHPGKRYGDALGIYLSAGRILLHNQTDHALVVELLEFDPEGRIMRATMHAVL